MNIVGNPKIFARESSGIRIDDVGQIPEMSFVFDQVRIGLRAPLSEIRVRADTEHPYGYRLGKIRIPAVNVAFDIVFGFKKGFQQRSGVPGIVVEREYRRARPVCRRRSAEHHGNAVRLHFFAAESAHIVGSHDVFARGFVADGFDHRFRNGVVIRIGYRRAVSRDCADVACRAAERGHFHVYLSVTVSDQTGIVAADAAQIRIRDTGGGAALCKRVGYNARVLADKTAHVHFSPDASVKEAFGNVACVVSGESAGISESVNASAGNSHAAYRTGIAYVSE